MKYAFSKAAFYAALPVACLLITCLLLHLAVTAQPLAETGPKKPMPPEWIDQDTHHKVVRLSRKDGNNSSFYFHNNPFIGNKMVFYSTDQKGKQIYTVDLKTLKIEQITNVTRPSDSTVRMAGPNGEIVGTHSRSVNGSG